MASPQETDELANQQWHARFAKERLNLSASVEEALAEPAIEEDLLADEEECVPDKTDEPVSESHSVPIIPPKLSLQSKTMPAVRLEPPGTTLDAKIVTAPAPTTLPMETSGRSQKKQRLGGRTTKVRLQAIAKTEQKSGKKGKSEKVDPDRERETVAGKQTLAVSDELHKPEGDGKAIAEKQLESSTTRRGKLSGSGLFERGQEVASVANPHISSSSVVIVTLIEDPGPVVVQYVTLQPQTGFTVHLSAPAIKQAAFNYVILLTELF